MFDQSTERIVRACDALARVQVLKVPVKHWSGVYQHKKTEEKTVEDLLALWGAGWEAQAWHESDVLYAALFHTSSGKCVIHFRGSTTASNWIADAKDELVPNATLGIRVHRGFNDVAEKIYPALVGNLQGSGWAIKSLEFSGHSLGGALAVLLAMHFEAKPLQVGGSLIVATAITTSGQPMVTDHADLDGPSLGARIVRYTSAKLLRIRNEKDPVPFAFQSYRHLGSELFFSRDGAVLTGVTHFDEAPATAHTPPMKKFEMAREFFKNAASHVTDSAVGYLTPLESWAKMVKGGDAALESCGLRRVAIQTWTSKL